ncbi:MAG: 6,7-dimethyl-8-ribityllumazine synthase [Candidatus Omnitrophica bacterium]|nr:6,7-dimethyl-8-ribityllumazine synthase [Candidatus Omnitrophota bacterium]
MIKKIEGKGKSPRKNFGIVVSRFNDFITEKLLDGCLKELARLGVKKNQITVVWVPGAFEIPLTALKLAKKKTVSGVICLGAVIRGDTFHFELVAENCAAGIREASLITGKPVVLGVITTDTINQAYARSKDNGDNKGKEAACALVEMVNVLSKI